MACGQKTGKLANLVPPFLAHFFRSWRDRDDYSAAGFRPCREKRREQIRELAGKAPLAAQFPGDERILGDGVIREKRQDAIYRFQHPEGSAIYAEPRSGYEGPSAFQAARAGQNTGVERKKRRAAFAAERNAGMRRSAAGKA